MALLCRLHCAIQKAINDFKVTGAHKTKLINRLKCSNKILGIFKMLKKQHEIH